MSYQSAYLQRLKDNKNDLDLIRTNGTVGEVFNTTPISYKTPSYGRWFMGRDYQGNNIIRERRAGLTPAINELPRSDVYYTHKSMGRFNTKFQYNSTANSHRSRNVDGTIITRP